MEFYKYQGTGNDFIMIDNRNLAFPKNTDIIQKLCNRRFGIGSDGLILLEDHSQYDFHMIYYNGDGNESTMCGNGGRCIVAFAHFLGIFKKTTKFMAIDGLHESEINGDLVKLKMIDVTTIENFSKYTILNTGSPHYVEFVDDVKNMNVYLEGKKIRNNNIFKKEGINVNFVTQINENELFVRTFERGVENETYSCGTGATASALTFLQNHDRTFVNIKVLGGTLKVYAEKIKNGFHNIWLEGIAQQVFRGTLEIK